MDGFIHVCLCWAFRNYLPFLIYSADSYSFRIKQSRMHAAASVVNDFHSSHWYTPDEREASECGKPNANIIRVRANEKENGSLKKQIYCFRWKRERTEADWCSKNEKEKSKNKKKQKESNYVRKTLAALNVVFAWIFATSSDTRSLSEPTPVLSLSHHWCACVCLCHCLC